MAPAGRRMHGIPRGARLCDHWRGVALASLVLVGACNDVDDFDQRVLGPDRVITAGRADFTRFVVIGDSYGAGVVNGAFTCSGQVRAYPAVIARQVGLEVADACNPPQAVPTRVSAFQQPLVTDPGLGSPVRLADPGPPPVIVPVLERGAPTNGALPRPYNNLSVPGADLAEVNVARNQATSLDGNSAFNIVLRGFGTSIEQARTLDATFVVFWLGGNDVLVSVLSGGTTAVTRPAAFEQEYQDALDDLLKVTDQVVLGNVGDVSAFPFATTIPAVAVDPATGQPVLIGGQPVPLIGPSGPLAPGQDLVLLPAASLLAAGVGVPAQLGGTGQPLPDQVVLDAVEVAEVRSAAQAYNATIAAAAAAHGLLLVDFGAQLEAALAAGGTVEANGEVLSLRFLGGGAAAPFFGLDGFHPTPKGYGHIANLFIQAINPEYGASIPLVDVSALPTLIDAAPGGDRVPALTARAPSPVVAPAAGASAGAARARPFAVVRWPAELDTSLW